MKRVFNAMMEQLVTETDYDYDFLVERYNECMDEGGTVIDFVDITLDQNW